MAISLRLNDEETILIKKYAALHNISLSELFRQAVIEKIEDEYDLSAYDKAIAAYKADPVKFSLKEVEKELGLR